MSGTVTYVPSGTTFSGIVQPGDELIVEINAASDDTEVYGTEFIENVRDQVASQNGFGTAADNVVESGGTMSVDGAATQCTVDGGGMMTVQNGGQASNDAIYGTENVSGFSSASNETVHTGGTIFVEGDGGLSDPIIAGGTVIVGFEGLVGDQVTFAGPGGTIELNSVNTLNLVFDGFSNGDSIAVTDALNLSLSVSGNEVVLGGVTLDIVGASDDNLVVGFVDGFAAVECVCFLAGTAIATPGGCRAIESLRTGDLVLTADGLAQPVRWLGRQTVATRFADPLRTAPIRIRRAALGDDLPVRDLHVSPDHALMVDGVFVQAGALVNGVSITREDRDLPERFVYFHVELADHALILAEGVPAETFIDNVDRLAFDNWDEHAALDDATAPMREMSHPRAKAHRQVPAALRARLLARGCALAGQALAAIA